MSDYASCPASAAGTSVPLAPPVQPNWWRGMALHALRTVGIGLAVALFLTLVSGGNFLIQLVYAQCISLGCWFFIDGLRVSIAKFKHRAAPTASEEALNFWPGWGWMAFCLVLGTVAGIALGSSLADWLTGHPWQAERYLALRPMLSMLAFSILPGVGFSYYYYSKQKLRSAEARAEVARRQAAEHQLKLLESQLEPHMLFNTLANLRVLITLDPPRAQAMLDQLIAFLRATLNGSRTGQHALSAEFARLADYLALMQVRMGERLQVGFSLPPDLADAPVPPMLLQPLVENCIKHGLEPSVDGGRIDIAARCDAGTLVLTVRDTGCGATAPESASAATSAAGSTHFGLQQVRERLAALYGRAASLQLEAAADGQGGMLATLRMPLAAVGVGIGVGVNVGVHVGSSAVESPHRERVLLHE